MAKMSSKQLKNIVEKGGYKLAQKAPVQDAHPAEAEAATPELEALRSKYLRGGTAAFAASEPPPADSAENTDDEIVAVESREKTGDAWSRGSTAKSVVISGKNKTIIGSQG
jgi:hypothetical protein